MALTGPEPKREKIGSTPNADWIDVPDVPFAGAHPELPDTRTMVNAFGIPHIVELQDATRGWWSILAAMPHCALWTAADWAYAVDTALLKDVFYASPGSTVAIAVEIRRREDQLGTTAEARRKLRIRYVEQHVVTATALDDVDLGTLTVKQLRKFAGERKIDVRGCRTKRDVLAAIDAAAPSNVSSLADQRRRRLTSAP